MNQRYWERPTCFLCDYSWAVLLVLILGVAVYFLRGYLLPREPALGTGDVQVTLRWEGYNDLDLHVISPNGERISYSHTVSQDGGKLDVDGNANCQSNMSDHPVENIFWPVGEAPHGDYSIIVVYYAGCEPPVETPFTVTVKVDGKSEKFSGMVHQVNETQDMHQFNR